MEGMRVFDGTVSHNVHTRIQQQRVVDVVVYTVTPVAMHVAMFMERHTTTTMAMYIAARLM